MNINAINNTSFKGFLQINNKTKINTDDIQEIRKNQYREKVAIWYQNEKGREDYPKLQLLDNTSYQNVLNAYIAASQNPNVVIDLERK